MIGTAVGLTVAGRFITTIMFTYLIRRSRHAATILQDLRLQIAPGESAARVVWAVPVESVAPAEWVAPAESEVLAESAGPGELVDRGELAGLAASVGPEESAGLGELADHLLGHTIRLSRGRTRAQSRVSRRQALFPTIQDWETRTEIWPRTSPYEMGMGRRGQPMGWHLTDLQLRIAPTISSEDLATLPIPGADAMEHSVAINPAEELKPRATAEGPASAGVVEVEARAAAAVAAAAEVAAEDVAAAVADDVSWRFGPRGPSIGSC
jgi:hypothetical protein